MLIPPKCFITHIQFAYFTFFYIHIPLNTARSIKVINIFFFYVLCFYSLNLTHDFVFNICLCIFCFVQLLQAIFNFLKQAYYKIYFSKDKNVHYTRRLWRLHVSHYYYLKRMLFCYSAFLLLYSTARKTAIPMMFVGKLKFHICTKWIVHVRVGATLV